MGKAKLTKKACLEIIMKFNHSPARVPYTYHHDLVRARLDGGMSRADVASLSEDTDEVALYASALAYLLENTNMIDGMYVVTSSEDRKICEQALLVTNKHIAKLSNKLKEKGVGK